MLRRELEICEVPRIKRYWPCSHGFNRDPEVQALRRQYGDWMGYVWQELCAIGDLNDGEVKGTFDQIGLSLAYVSLLNRPSLAAKRITNALHFMVNCGWIERRLDSVLILNHRKYHASQYTEKVPPNDPNDPNERSEQSKNKKASLVYDFYFEQFWKSYPKHVGKKQAAEQWKKDSALLVNMSAEIQVGIARLKEIRRARAEAKLFTPEWSDPVRFLKNHRWLDELEKPAEAKTLTPPWVKYGKKNI